MTDSSKLAERLRSVVAGEAEQLRGLDDENTIEKPSVKAWSPKQELGHLIDSAANNHARIVRAAIGPGEFAGPGYAQDSWVQLHGYQDLPWGDIVTFWESFNMLLVRVIARIPPERFQVSCTIGDNTPMPLNLLIDDYLVHMQHHLDHILGRATITPYPQVTGATI